MADPPARTFRGIGIGWKDFGLDRAEEGDQEWLYSDQDDNPRQTRFNTLLPMGKVNMAIENRAVKKRRAYIVYLSGDEGNISSERSNGRVRNNGR